MIRQLFLAIALILTAMPGMSRTLKIYSITGKVSKKTDAGWVALKKNGEVTDADMLKINQASSIKLIDNIIHKVHVFDQPGESLVSRLIDKSLRESSSITSRMVAESRKQMSGAKSHGTSGASIRGTDDESLLETLFTALNNGFQAAENKGDISLTKVADSDGLFHLRITNNGNNELYANVFIHTEHTLWEALYKFDGEESALYLAPHSSIEIKHIQLASSPDIQLAAVAYDSPFEGEDLADMLSASLIPEAPPAPNVSFFFLK